MPRQRLDILLTESGLAETRSHARALIMAGLVLVNDVPVDKAGTLVAGTATLRLRNISKYVSRGGLKLEKALREFNINVHDKTCLDVGQSTGGFTDCLLQHGAKKVFGVDVGKDQLHWKIRTDARVKVFEQCNFRHFDVSLIADNIDIAVIDASFISLRLLVPKVIEIFKRGICAPTLIALIKPQFEVGKENVGKGGIVRDAEARRRVVEEIKVFVMAKGFKEVSVTESPITGSDGNMEYLLHAIWGA